MHTLQIENSSVNISALALNLDWLYVTEGSHLGANNGRLLRVNITGFMAYSRFPEAER